MCAQHTLLADPKAQEPPKRACALARKRQGAATLCCAKLNFQAGTYVMRTQTRQTIEQPRSRLRPRRWRSRRGDPVAERHTRSPPRRGGGIAAPPVRAGRCTVYYADFELTNNNNTANKQGCVVCMYQERFGCLHTGVQAPGGAQAPAQRGRSSGVRNAARGCVFRSRKSEADRALL